MSCKGTRFFLYEQEKETFYAKIQKKVAPLALPKELLHGYAKEKTIFSLAYLKT